MAEEQNMLNIMVVWRGRQFNVKMNSNSSIKEFGHKLQTLTHVKPDTMRLLMPRSTNKGSKLLTPFSDEHSNLSLQEAAIHEGKPIRMMGVFDDEIEDVSRNSMKDLRIAGFDEEEKRLKQRLLDRPQASLKLPQGTYIFCDFRTLQLPGIELNPPASEALKRMHMLACDPGVIAIMNKYRWSVGIMTEMAPVGYVGISPKCILGFNKNHGEEISLRLRTDDLKGFRKYESIKKTLFHELAHMVYSEHDANFYALDKQLNQEAASLDWTKSRGHTLSGHRYSDRYEEEFDFDVKIGVAAQKLGGRPLNSSTDARAFAAAAAYHRLLNASTDSNSSGVQVQAESIYTNGKIAHHEPDPDDCKTNNGTTEYQNMLEPDPDDSHMKENVVAGTSIEIYSKPSVSSGYKECNEPDPDDCSDEENMFEPDPDDSHIGEAMESEPYLGISAKFYNPKSCEEPDPDDSLNNMIGPDPDDSQVVETAKDATHSKLGGYPFPEKTCEKEPDPDDIKEKETILENGNCAIPDPDSQVDNVTLTEPDPDDCMGNSFATKPEMKDTVPTWEKYGMQSDVRCPDDAQIDDAMSAVDSHNSEANGSFHTVLASDNQELQRIEDPVAAVCTRLQKAIEVLLSEVTPMEANSVLQTLFKIIRNAIEHPDEMKFRRLRKANPLFQKNVANYKAAMEVLSVVGFHEDVVPDEIGRAETYMVLKRNDPGLLWLAKSSLEMCIG